MGSPGLLEKHLSCRSGEVCLPTGHFPPAGVRLLPAWPEFAYHHSHEATTVAQVATCLNGCQARLRRSANFFASKGKSWATTSKDITLRVVMNSYYEEL